LYNRARFDPRRGMAMVVWLKRIVVCGAL